MYPSELQLNKANTTATEAPFLDLHLSVANRFVYSNIYNKREILFVDGDVPRRVSYGVYISQPRLARVCYHVADCNARNKCLQPNSSSRANGIINFEKNIFSIYRRHYELISKFNVGLKMLLRDGLSEPVFYGDLVYKFKKLIGRYDFFSVQKNHNTLLTYVYMV